ncbi:MAG: PEP/pyruvate-binding domain-containing protein [Chitinophagales bacterium]
MAEDPEEARKRISDISFPEYISEQLLAFFGADASAKFYAVRSSAIDEDGKEHSFAGQFDTFLNVPYGHIVQRIKDIWLSAANERVLTYRKTHGLTIQYGIAVIIQEMLVPEVSGVAFGMDPVSGNTETKVINAVYGAGEGLVSGALNADTFIITPGGIEKRIAHKTHAYYPVPYGEGLSSMELSAGMQDVACLTNEQIHSLGNTLNTLEKLFGGAQDVEFAIVKNTIWYLQSRPVTAAAQTSEEYILWDNSNIVESYPGITTPLTFSFIKKMYAAVYENFVALLGVSPRQIKKYRYVFENTLGLVRGRVYYNLLSWYKMLAMVPGYSINAGFMENMMGVKERFTLREDFRLSKQTAWLRTLWIICKLFWLHFRLPALRRSFNKHLEKTMLEYKDLHFEEMGIPEIIQKYLTFEYTLVEKWKAPLINDFFAMIWFGLLQKQTDSILPQGQQNIHNDLLCNSKDIISVEPVHMIMHIVEMIYNDPEAHTLFITEEAEILWGKLQSPHFIELQNAIHAYIATFGERCIGELKLESESITQNPLLLITTLQAYTKQGLRGSFARQHIEQNVREHAEQSMRRALRKKPLKRLLFHYTLRNARTMVSNRENLRFERTKGFGMVRKMFFAIGKKLQSTGAISDVKDVFYLTLDEVLHLHAEFDSALQKNIAARKAAFEAYHLQPAPKERFYTYGQHFTDAFIYSDDKIEKAKNTLQGIGCCPGELEGTVRVVSNPYAETHLQGDILVTTSTDPGWITLFPTASAILVERGSLLSHSAIVSRELGIPCIVGISGLLRSVKTGDRIYMNGSTGEVKLLNT